jgi:NifB/MoaA-like Fe-S oxidoreductase
VVPVGLSKYRDGLYPLEPFTKAEAEEVIDLIEDWQKKCWKESGLHFVHASDEWYILADRDLPKASSYDGYLQLENGVGMMRLFQDEFLEALEEKREKLEETNRGNSKPKYSISMGTGILAAPLIQKLAQYFMEQYPDYQIKVYPIINHFFGAGVTVSGLLTGQDVIEQLKGQDLGQCLFLPINLLRSGEEVFLDDVTLSQVETALQVPVDVVESNGYRLLEKLLSIGE